MNLSVNETYYNLVFSLLFLGYNLLLLLDPLIDRKFFLGGG